MIAAWLAIVAQAGSGAALDARATTPEAPYQGSFDRPPAFHYRQRLPGGRLNAASHAEWSDPVISGGRIYVGAAAGDGLYALNRTTGVWAQTYPAESSVEAPPVLIDDRLFFSDTAGNTYAYRLDGTLLWRHDGNAPILSAPTLQDDRVVVTNVDDVAIALDATTGTLLWQVKAPRDATRSAELALFAAPDAVFVDGEVLLGFSSGTLMAVDVDTGEEVWRREIGEGRYPDLVATPVVAGTDIFSAGYYEPLVAVDRDTQSIRWRVDVGGAYKPLLDATTKGARLFHPGTDGSLRAIDTLTGAVLWTWESGTRGAITTPVATEAGLIVASSEGSVYLVDPDSGVELWRWREPWLLRGVSSVPAVDGRQLVFISNAGEVYSMRAVRRRPPRRLWP